MCNCLPCSSSSGQLPQAPPPECSGGEPCDTIAFSSCVLYRGPNLPFLGITDGMRMKEALAALQVKLQPSFTTTQYRLSVSSTQTTSTAEYIGADGLIKSVTVKRGDDPAVFTAQVDSPVKIKGTGVLEPYNP